MKGEILSLKTSEKLVKREMAIKYIKKEIKEMPVNGCRIRLEKILNLLEVKDEPKQS